MHLLLNMNEVMNVENLKVPSIEIIGKQNKEC